MDNTLYLKILNVCPIVGISVGDPEDKTTWRIDFANTATEEERAEANKIIQDFDINAPSVPMSVTPRQARLALFNAGLLDQVESSVNTVGGSSKITWEYATQIDRDDPLITTLGQSLNLTDQQIDNLFIQAATL